ncbi:TPA: restriction endonuclease subunit S [Vibrio parahaemolyticus]|nr:restriction endonuclease subunit S [Vibrio parahaemolyticus]
MTGRYKAYPEYKNSGLDWLGQIPSHWEVTKTAWHFSAEKGKNGQLLTNEYIGQNEGDYPVYSGQTGNNGVMGCINSYEFDTGKEGVLFSTTVGAKAMTLSHLKGKFSLSQNCLIIQNKSPIFNTRFCFYHFQPLFFFERGLIPEHMQASFRMEDLYQYKIASPSFSEQQKIANFLDHETTKIDTLITKQEKLIELLREKREASLYHTVTMGLNPNSEYIETGIDWAPFAPRNWSLVPNRSVMSIRRAVVGQAYVKYQLLSLTKKGVLIRDISSGEGKQSDYLNRTQEVRKGDLVFCLFDVEETPRTVGLSHHLGMISGDYTIFECSDLDTARFLEHFYKAMDDRKLLKPLYRGLRKRIPKPEFLRVNVPIPPKEELKDILLYLDNLEERVKRLVTLAEEQISLLQERKSALISATVTGKIDVRDWESSR